VSRRSKLVQSLGAAALVLLTGTEGAGDADFAGWLAAVRREAERRGVSASTIRSALTGLSPIRRVLELDRRQPEFTLPLREYLARAVSARRIERGRERLAEHQAVLGEIGGRYRVPPAIIVALWGLETDYGQVTGDFPLIAALATLAHDGRRGAFFREELFAALRMIDLGHGTASGLRGSWAGATGQSQFMPSSFLRYAVDHDGDGRPDIWRSHSDVFASIANYLAHAGWQEAAPWGYPIRLAAGTDGARVGGVATRPLSGWRDAGVHLADGGELPGGAALATLLLPEGPEGPAFVVLENHQVLLRWNRSVAFATAAGLLADALGAGHAGAAR
jgi:membrane-bound lytic murein transglycosylase B